MSFPRHPEIYPPMEAQTNAVGAPAHRLDEFPAGYSLAGCSPAEPASASPAGNQYSVQSSCRSRFIQRTANSVLTVCVSSGGKRNSTLGLDACIANRIKRDWQEEQGRNRKQAAGAVASFRASNGAMRIPDWDKKYQEALKAEEGGKRAEQKGLF